MLYRAYYDAYVRSRLIYETDLEERASITCVRPARRAPLSPSKKPSLFSTGPSHARWRPTCVHSMFELAEALFQSIRMQLSVPRYQAIDVGRGATLDTIDQVLNNRLWLKGRFEAVKKLGTEPARLAAIDTVVNWTNPGPGGYYDDLGDPSGRPHLVRGSTFENDPAFFHGPMTAFDQDPTWRRSWCRHAGTIFGQPLSLRYERLDQTASYRLRVVYTGDMFQVKIGLKANDLIEVHPPLLKPRDMTPLEFDLPAAATRNGILTLTWTAEPNRGGNGRGCQVSEVWLIKK